MPSQNSITPYKEIPLSRGMVALVDAEDFDRAMAYKWQAVPANLSKTKWYARGAVNGRADFLHRFILNTPSNKFTDHRNGNGLDCRRCNLRAATGSQNQANKGKLRNNTSGYKGVRKNGKRWYAQITVNGKRHSAPGGNTPEEAARVYDTLAREMFGEFACVNFPFSTKAAQKEARAAA